MYIFTFYKNTIKITIKRTHKLVNVVKDSASRVQRTLLQFAIPFGQRFPIAETQPILCKNTKHLANSSLPKQVDLRNHFKKRMMYIWNFSYLFIR